MLRFGQVPRRVARIAKSEWLKDPEWGESGVIGDEQGAGEIPRELRLSLCAGCSHKRDVRSGRGAWFFLCQIGVGRKDWPKYPPQPLQHCLHFQNLSSEPIRPDKPAETEPVATSTPIRGDHGPPENRKWTLPPPDGSP